MFYFNLYQTIRILKTGFTKLHMGLMVLVKKMSVLINLLLQNTNVVSVLSRTDEFHELLYNELTGENPVMRRCLEKLTPKVGIG